MPGYIGHFASDGHSSDEVSSMFDHAIQLLWVSAYILLLDLWDQMFDKRILFCLFISNPSVSRPRDYHLFIQSLTESVRTGSNIRINSQSRDCRSA